MTRSLRFALVLVLAITLLAVGGALAFNMEGPNTDRVVDLLDDAGITTDAATLDALADQYGLGGAVRILAFADAAGVDPSEVAAMRDDGMGWGQIARELDIDVGPGIGWIMSGGHGQAQDQATGQGAGSGNGHGWGPGGNPNKGTETDGDDAAD